MSAVLDWANSGIDGSLVRRAGRMLAPEASGRFSYLVESIASAYEPTPTQIETLDRAYNATGDYLTSCPEFEGQLTGVHAQGSRQLGTIVRPMDAQREGFDIDLVARLAGSAIFRYQGERGAALLLDHLFKAMERYAQRHGLAIKRWERCVTLTYADGMCADFAPIIDDPSYVVQHGQHHGRIPDRSLQRYLSTNPKGYCLMFDEIAKIQPRFRTVVLDSADLKKRADIEPLPDAPEVLGRLLSRFVQFGKVHRNVMFGSMPDGKSVAPTSVFLTTLVAKAYALEAPLPHDNPLDLFFDMIDRLPHLFQREALRNGGEWWTLQNPCAQNDNLAESMNSPERQRAFRTWYAKLRQDLDELVGAASALGLESNMKVIERSFGTRASQAILQRGADRREQHRALNRAAFVAAGSVPMIASARSHTYFGGPVK